jgi:hypothetical protein
MKLFFNYHTFVSLQKGHEETQEHRKKSRSP